jgi:hypothetical protein
LPPDGPINWPNSASIAERATGAADDDGDSTGAEGDDGDATGAEGDTTVEEIDVLSGEDTCCVFKDVGVVGDGEEACIGDSVCGAADCAGLVVGLQGPEIEFARETCGEGRGDVFRETLGLAGRGGRAGRLGMAGRGLGRGLVLGRADAALFLSADFGISAFF